MLTVRIVFRLSRNNVALICGLMRLPVKYNFSTAFPVTASLKIKQQSQIFQCFYEGLCFFQALVIFALRV